ncbi:MAG: carbohydrate kinase family protein [Chloroflexi bacterium]|nr:carbohydrate kinase family protein [Chloroflexota bacterium]MCI0578179.1 carbohydrate kinase family protein [Chloroflexota bacterium]MCI0649160.1 carbohydrate kinase family protein [Chloroflexota bacterium]MCI0725349.1 carbohydrate kinase family protein [Chloroflexota bacterium]
MGDHVLVIGATLLDTKGKPTAGLEPRTSNPGHIRHTRGGTARNVAENLARLGAKAMLVSAVGDDYTGRQLLDHTAEAGVNVENVSIIAGQHTGSYIALLDADGSLSVALDDVHVMENITAAYLYQNRRLFRDAQMVIVDGSLSPSSLEMAVRLAEQYNALLCADPSSTRLAYKLHPYLAKLHLIVPNEVEAAALCQADFAGYDPDASLEIAYLLRRAGVQTVIVTLSDFGLVYATSDETGYIPARYSEMVDSTGTGDALTAAVIFGIINELPVIESIRLGAAAASLTLQTSHTVVPDLSLDMLYDHLII